MADQHLSDRAERVRKAARDWVEGDPDPQTRQALEALLDVDDLDGLAEAVDGELEFGTAGLRGIVGPGPRRMNRAVVIRTTRGLADHLARTGVDPDRPVVLGFDARPDSERFARDVVAVMAGAGRPVRTFTEPVPTPVVAYAARVLDAAAAVVITASHNPPEYNGYKVYGPNAVQIVPPTDRQIAAAIGEVGPADEVPRADGDTASPGLVGELGTEMVDRYLADLDAQRFAPVTSSDLDIVYTPLHGVGWRLTGPALVNAGHRVVHAVPAQVDPDGTFPTVSFPNPEEPGALDLAMALATERDADLILANDPDADRLAVCVPGPGGWRALTGNEIGVLLAEHVLDNVAPGGPRPVVVSSIVSSPMLTDVAAAHGAHHEVSLTGFKWICNAGLALEEQGVGQFLYGYEEALGYTVGRLVRDKDGISAAVAFADLAERLRAEGRRVDDLLDDLARRHGLWVSHQHSITRPGREGRHEIEAAMGRIGEDQAPERLAGLAVTAVSDYRTGASRRPAWLGRTPLVACELGDAGRALVRPSGTEPKLKIYVDLRVTVGADDDLVERRRELADRARDVATSLAEQLGLG